MREYLDETDLPYSHLHLFDDKYISTSTFCSLPQTIYPKNDSHCFLSQMSDTQQSSSAINPPRIRRFSDANPSHQSREYINYKPRHCYMCPQWLCAREQENALCAKVASYSVSLLHFLWDYTEHVSLFWVRLRGQKFG